MWQRRKVFKCTTCGRESVSRLNAAVNFTETLPQGWKGSSCMRGVCFCEKCSANIRDGVRGRKDR